MTQTVPPERATTPPEPPGEGTPRRRRAFGLAVVGCVLAVVLGLILFVGRGSGPSASGPAPGISTAASSLLNLDVLPPGNTIPATNFTLTDQYGHPVSLSQFRGKSVVLSFNDDQCPDLCTLLAQSIVVANRDMGAASHHVVFLSVNVNPFYPQVAAVKSWTDHHGLGGQRNWVFTTGAVPELQSIWKDYGVYVHLDTANRTVQHGAQLYFIDPSGHERAIGSFGTNAANTTLFAHNLAQMAVDLLPPAQRTTVAGPLTAPSAAAAAVGGAAPGFSLPRLDNPRQHLSLAALHGKYVVLNFWSSTCTACVQEMPHVEAAYRQLGAKVAFVGVDVSDTGDPRSFARAAGVTYPVVADTAGSVAGAYQISGLPFTAVIGPGGKLLIRHPGALTTEQLTYVLENIDMSLGGG